MGGILIFGNNGCALTRPRESGAAMSWWGSGADFPIGNRA
jgi:hypothetical protein